MILSFPEKLIAANIKESMWLFYWGFFLDFKIIEHVETDSKLNTFAWFLFWKFIQIVYFIAQIQLIFFRHIPTDSQNFQSRILF
jgi:hypothetical protein